MLTIYIRSSFIITTRPKCNKFKNIYRRIKSILHENRPALLGANNLISHVEVNSQSQSYHHQTIYRLYNTTMEWIVLVCITSDDTHCNCLSLWPLGTHTFIMSQHQFYLWDSDSDTQTHAHAYNRSASACTWIVCVNWILSHPSRAELKSPRNAGDKTYYKESEHFTQFHTHIHTPTNTHTHTRRTFAMRAHTYARECIQNRPCAYCARCSAVSLLSVYNDDLVASARGRFFQS